jgi:hypothetical protein
MAQYTTSGGFITEKGSVGFLWRLLAFSGLVFGLAVLAYLGMLIGYEPLLQKQSEELDKKISDLSRVISKEDQETLVNFYSQIVNLRTLLDEHVAFSKILTLLERNTNQNVFYTRARFNKDTRQLELEGVARDYTELVRQMEAYRQLKEVDNFLLTDSEQAEGGINFRLQLRLKPEAFKAKEMQ